MKKRTSLGSVKRVTDSSVSKVLSNISVWNYLTLSVVYEALKGSRRNCF